MIAGWMDVWRTLAGGCCNLVDTRSRLRLAGVRDLPYTLVT